MPDPLSMGKVIDEYSTTTLVSATLATRYITCPANRRWWLFLVTMLNGDSVTRTLTISLYNSSNELLSVLYSVAVATMATLSWPNAASTYAYSNGSSPLPMKAGDYLKLEWAAGAASAGGTAKSAIICLDCPV